MAKYFIALSSKQNVAINLSGVYSKHKWLPVSMKCLQNKNDLESNWSQTDTSLKFKSAAKVPNLVQQHTPTLTPCTDGSNWKKTSYRSNQRPKYKSTVAHTDHHFMNSRKKFNWNHPEYQVSGRGTSLRCRNRDVSTH